MNRTECRQIVVRVAGVKGAGLPLACLGIVLLAAAGCTTTGTTGTISVRPDQLGDFSCAEPAKAKAPPRILALGIVRGEKREIVRREGKPLLDVRPCPAGRVPVSKTPAKSTVAKGNPLIGKIDMPPDVFFRGRPAGEEIQRRLLPFTKVYFIPPGPDEKSHRVPPDPPGCNGTLSFGSCYYYGPAAYSRTADGGGMTMRIDRPAISGTPTHSLNEISVQGGTGDGNIVELGWNVSASQYSDSDPHLFIFHWMNWNPTCYDDCNFQQSSATYFPGMNLSALVGREVYVGYVFYQGNWWAWFDNQWLGYFPGSEWNGAYTQNDLIQWFGEVAADSVIPPDIQMGDGLFPTDPSAAKDSTLCDVDAAAWVCWYRDLQSLGPNYPPYYDIRRTAFGETHYGGPGH